MKTVYIAGKITGDPDYCSKFKAAQTELEKEGFIVVSPTILPSTGFSYEAYMRMTQAMLDECEVACFLPDWYESDGAVHEFCRAIEKNKETFLYVDWLKKEREGDHAKEIC